MAKIQPRKDDHIRIALEHEVTTDYYFWDDVRLIHEALPEVDYDKIDTSSKVLGKKLDFPFIVTAITGGSENAKKINENIAKACSELGVGMGLGSQRAALEKEEKKSYSLVKDYDIPLVIGNIGAAQFVNQKKRKAIGEKELNEMIELVDADYLAVHLNFLQELVQPEGDTNSKGCFEAIRKYARNYPLIAKETGAGISGITSKKLYDVGVKAIDIAGMGGTSFAGIEMFRSIEQNNEVKAEIGSTFFDWGIPATVSLLCTENSIPTIASGGINTGLDIAKSIAMGAICAGGANVILKSATESSKAVMETLELLKEEFKVAMMLTGSSNVKELSKQEYILIGETKQWMDGFYE